MWRDLRWFMAERCPLPVMLLLAAVLYGAPALLREPGWSKVLLGVLSTLCGLVTLRVVDDLSDLAEDRRCHPRRGLVSGRIAPSGLKKAAVLLLALELGLNLTPPGSIYVGLLMGAYLIYYGLKERLSVVWQPLGVNLIFAVLPFYAAGWSVSVLFLALFIWLAVVGHDYCHSVHTLDEGCQGRRTPSTCWGPKGAAMAGVGAFVLSVTAGGGFWIVAGRPLFFALALAASLLGLLVLGPALIVNPCRARAQVFYVPGFLFFVLPLAGLIMDNLGR